MFGPRKPQSGQHLTEELLSAYLDGQVTTGERARAEAHLVSCPACAGELRALRATVGLLRELPPAPLPRAFTLPATVPRRRASLWDTLSRGWGYRTLQGATVLAAVLLMALCSGDLLLQTLPAMAPVARAPAAPPTQAVDREQLAFQPSPTEARAVRPEETTVAAPGFPAPTKPPAPASTPAGKAAYEGTETPLPFAGARPETTTPAPPAPSVETPGPVASAPAPSVAATPGPETAVCAQAVATPTEAATDAGATPSPAPTAVVRASAPVTSPLLEAEPAPAAGPPPNLARLVICGLEGALLVTVSGLAAITGVAWLVRHRQIDYH